MDGLTRATIGICGGLVVATPCYFTLAFLHARLLGAPFAAVAWLLALWVAAGLYLWRRDSVASGLRWVALATGAGCGLAPLLHVALSGGAGSTGSVNVAFAVLAAVCFVCARGLRGWT